MQYRKYHAPQHLGIEYLNKKYCQFSSFKWQVKTTQEWQRN